MPAKKMDEIIVPQSIQSVYGVETGGFDISIGLILSSGPSVVQVSISSENCWGSVVSIDKSF